MTEFWQLAGLLREHVNATAWRSDVLKPLAWLVGIVGLVLIFLAFARSPEWLLAWITFALLGLIVLYAVLNVICFIIDRDALRSESYSLNKMAIEHKLFGDSSTGMFDSKELIDQPPISEQSPKRITRHTSKSRKGES